MGERNALAKFKVKFRPCYQVFFEDRVVRLNARLTARAKDWGHCRVEKKTDLYQTAWSVIFAVERGAGPWGHWIARSLLF